MSGMRKLFTTDGLADSRKFQAWMDVWWSRFAAVEATRLGDETFQATLEAAQIGKLVLSRSTFGGQTVEATPTTVRLNHKQDRIAVLIRLSGSAMSQQGEWRSIQQPGDLTAFDVARPLKLEVPDRTSSLMIELPRDQLETMLGPARLYGGLTVPGTLPAAGLVRRFFGELVSVYPQMSAESADRMAQIGADLIVASIAERMAQDAPRAIQGTVTVQRAKALVEAHFGDPTLDPSQLALRLGVSLRHLQQLFQERGQQVANWIWQRRLQAAALRLSDRNQAHLSIGTLAYGCGFISQAHFSRRFREAFGMSPGDFRRAGGVSLP